MALERIMTHAMALWKARFLSRRRLIVRGGHCVCVCVVEYSNVHQV